MSDLLAVAKTNIPALIEGTVADDDNDDE